MPEMSRIMTEMDRLTETVFDLKTLEGRTATREYEWRDRNGFFHKIEDMSTSHLFHVVRMIWDHSVSKEWQTTYPKRYRFSRFYSVDYMSLSVKLMLPALLLRKDLTLDMIYWLEFMERCLLDRRLQIPFILKIDYKKEKHGGLA